MITTTLLANIRTFLAGIRTINSLWGANAKLNYDIRINKNLSDLRTWLILSFMYYTVSTIWINLYSELFQYVSKERKKINSDKVKYIKFLKYTQKKSNNNDEEIIQFLQPGNYTTYQLCEYGIDDTNSRKKELMNSII